TYWQERLRTISPPPDLPLAKHPESISNPHFMRRSARLDAEKWQQLKSQAAGHNLTPTALVLTAYVEVLAAWSASPRFTVNLPIQNRPAVHPQVNDVVGEFTSLSLLTVDCSSPSNFVDRARVIQKQLWEDLSHRQYSGTRVMRELAHAQGRTSSAVMPVVFTSALNLEMSGWMTGAADEVVYTTLQTPQVWLDHQVGEHEGVLNFNWDAVEGLFPDGMLDDMFQAFCRRLGQLAENDDSWFESVAITLPVAQLEERLSVNDTSVSLAPILLHTPFMQQARQYPERLAVVSSARNLTYGELDHCSNQVAAVLQQHRVARGKLVAVVMEKGWEQVAAVLGILKAGAAYVPVDPQLPESRRLSLLEDAKVDVILTQPWLAKTLRWPERMQLEIVEWKPSETAANILEEEAQQWDALAYVIYTSGSTGFPKGVMVDHRGAVNTVLDINRRFSVTAADRVLALSSLSFDLSVYDIFGTLAAGAAIVMPDTEGTRDPSAWVELMNRNSVTVWNTVPALMEMLVEYLADQREESNDRLRTIMLSGDWIPITLPGRIRSLFKDADIISLGGATEASIWSILHPIEVRDSSLPSIPYGRPMANQSFHVLNDRLEPCPVWVKGELYIGGIGLSKGYWRDEEKTRAHFITHPRTGERLYRTGDLGRYLPGSEIEFLGRKDSQVKVQGFRIELGEVEATLLQHASVRSAVVAVAGETGDSKRLVGFIVVEPGSGGSSIPEIREFLKDQLPRHMIPADLVLVDEIPITANGKIDRKALLALEPAVTKVDAAHVSPATDVERVLASIFEELLDISEVDTEANFFDLGANSLHIVRAHNRLRAAIEEHVPIVQFFKYPTIRSLVKNLKQKTAPIPVPSFSALRSDSDVSGDVAVIGMSCRFPGATNLKQFWNNLHDGIESMRSLSDEELLASGISRELLSRPDYIKVGAVIDGIEDFDAGFFRMSPREAETTDPQQRIFMEVAWEGLEHAGYDPQRYPGSIGVFAGANLSTYLLFNLDTRYASTVPGLPILLANDKDYLATHVSYKLNLRGPSLSIQTACSTSLVAIHMACQSLRNRECDMALAGGITVNVPQKTGYHYQLDGPVSPDGHCRAFDAQAQGTVLGNGVGVVVLKRLADALRDGDCIDAVIKGSAINNDGATKVGFTAPSVDGQAEVIARALADAGVGPESIGYVEAHGTGTPLGDPIEIAALSKAFSSDMLPVGSCAIGSVKTNVGHLDSAAGVAGFIKTVLSLKHGLLVPSLHYSTPNPEINFGRTPFYVNTSLRPWAVTSEGGTRRAGVSSFGIGGTNAHVVVEEYRGEGREVGEPRSGVMSGEVYVLPLSARDEGGLWELAQRYVALLQGLEGEDDAGAKLRDVCYSAGV
ncbi:MAG TPA: amino acid adenylation domain-containing protein, partial [Pyrinomonadaceae bacterium]